MIDWNDIAKKLSSLPESEWQFISKGLSGEEKKEVERIVKLWKVTGQPPDEFPVDIENDWKKIHEKLSTTKQTETKEVQWPVWLGRVAAVLTIGFIFSWLAVTYYSSVIEHSTASGEKLKIVLPDSTIVWINENTTISYNEDFGLYSREIHFTGEGWFEVYKDADKPFTIHGTQSKITVMGTSFNYLDKETDVAVFVETGKVAFNLVDGEDSVVLIKNQRSVLNQTTKELEIGTFNNLNHKAWLTGRMIFEDASLDEVVDQLSRYFKVEVNLTNEAMLNCRFTGKFEQLEVEEVTDVLATLYGFDITVGEEEWIINGKGCHE